MANILAAAGDTEVLGTSVTIDGISCIVVRTEMSGKEAGTFAALGLAVEGIRITMAIADLGYQPVIGKMMNVDGKRYEVKRSYLSGQKLKLTMVRPIG
jgi:hypothetical protein